MALFPAFAGLSSGNSNNEKQSKGLDWLNNQSFSTDEALSLHRRAIEQTEPGSQNSEISSPAVQKQKHRNEDEEDAKAKKRKKKEKKKKQKKHKKRSKAESESSGSESDTVYPSDLLKQATDPCRQEEEEEEYVSGSFVWLDDLQTPTDRPFCIDRKADPANWEYRSLYRADIARYRRKGSSALGLNPKTQSVSWVEPGSEKKKTDRKADRKSERYYSRGARQLLGSRGLPARPSVPGPGASLVAAHFIPVPPCVEEEGQAGPRGSSWVNPLGVYDPSTSLWLQGKGPAEHEKQQEAGPPGTAGDGGASSQLAARVEDFNRRLRETPTDTATWLEFVRFQDELTGGAGFFAGMEGEPDGRRKSLRMTLEKKVSILERALESNPTSVELKLARLKLCQELWEPAALLKEWKKLVFLHPNDAPLWRRYLLFTQSQFSTFSVSKVNGVYGKCLSTLASVQDGSMLSHPAQPGTEETMLEIFLQQCHFLRQAGHSEKAVSLFQAMLDFTFFKPDSVRELPTRQQVEFFEPFWDSGEPRVGEKGARGWKAWMHQQERGGWLVPNDPDDDDDDDQEDSSEVKDKTWPKWRIWLDVEASRESNQWLPWRPDKSKGQTEEDCEDPDRQVLFDDIGPSMIRLSAPELRFQLVCCFLQFLGLPGESWYHGPSWSSLLDDTSLLEEGPDAERLLTAGHLHGAGVSPVGHMTTLGGARRQTGLCKEGEEFVHHVLQQISPLCSPQEKALLSLYWIQYEKLKVMKCVQSGNKKRLRSQGKRSKKLAKRLLKEEENRGDLALWREYAHLEWLLGNLEEARKVFDTAMALGAARGLRDPALCRLCLLYAQLEAEEARGAAAPCTSSPAVHALTKLAEGGVYSPFTGQVPPVAVLKARKSYEQAFQTALERRAGSAHAGKGARVAELVGCFALFQYLTTGVEAADKVFGQALERLEGAADPDGGAASDSSAWGTPSELESLCLMQALLLQHHTSTSVFPLRRLRETLTAALSRFPANPLLWRLYLRLERRYHSAGRARRFFHTVTKGSQSVVPRLFAICAEQKRKELVSAALRADCYGEVFSTMPENGLSHRIRALYENAIASEHGAHCPLLWRMYLRFLVSEGNSERGSGILYKALQEIPWVKGLYMDAVQLFPDRVQEFLDLMTEKELRLRAPMEEVDILLED